MLDTLTNVANEDQVDSIKQLRKIYFFAMSPTILTTYINDGLHLVLVVDVSEGVQHVSEVLKIISNRFPPKNQTEIMYNMTMKYFHQLLDGLRPVLIVDVREGVQHVSEVLKININQFPIKNQAEMM